MARKYFVTIGKTRVPINFGVEGIYYLKQAYEMGVISKEKLKDASLKIIMSDIPFAPEEGIVGFGPETSKILQEIDEQLRKGGFEHLVGLSGVTTLN